jgi:DNA-binding GntR family transcriptional regulator
VPDQGALERLTARQAPQPGDARSLGVVAAREIRRAIQEGRIPTGTHLTEKDVAEWLGMSRTPVREAMRRLENEGLLLNEPFRGAMVMRLDAEDIRQLFAVRELLESAAASWCAEHATAAEIGAMRDLVAQEAEALADPRELMALNRRFHDAMFDAARNHFLRKAMIGVQASFPLLGDSNLLDKPRARAAHAQHRKILEAIARHDRAGAEAAARAHVRASLDYRLTRVASDRGR